MTKTRHTRPPEMEGVSYESGFSYVLNALLNAPDLTLTAKALVHARPNHMAPTTPHSAAARLAMLGVVERTHPIGARGIGYTLVDLDKLPDKWKGEFTPHQPHVCEQRVIRLSRAQGVEPPETPPTPPTPAPAPAAAHPGDEPGVAITLTILGGRRFRLDVPTAKLVWEQLDLIFGKTQV